LRVVVAAVLAVAADAVLVAQRLLKLGAHLVTALARLHVNNLARRSRLEAGSTREKKGGEERRNLSNSVWKFGKASMKCKWCARVYPERENLVILPLHPLELWSPCKARWVWAGAVAKYFFGHVLVAIRQGQRRDAAATGENDSVDVQRGRVNISGFIGRVAS
jgi:hypothetical protein